MLVHGIRTIEQLREVVITDREHDRQTNRRPQGIAPADPVPELKHIGGINTKLSYCIRISGQRGKVLRHMRRVFGRRQEPVTRGMGVSHGFLGGKSFGGDQKQCGFRIQRFQGFGDMSTVNIRDKMHAQMIFIRTQRLCHHIRAEIRAADTDIHHIGNRPAGIAFPLPADDPLTEHAHFFQHGANLRHHILPVSHHRSIVTVAQRGVQNRTVFCPVDLRTGKHTADGPTHITLFSQCQQLIKGFLCDTVFGIIHQHFFAERGRKTAEPVVILRK